MTASLLKLLIHKKVRLMIVCCFKMLLAVVRVTVLRARVGSHLSACKAAMLHSAPYSVGGWHHDKWVVAVSEAQSILKKPLPLKYSCGTLLHIHLPWYPTMIDTDIQVLIDRLTDQSMSQTNKLKPAMQHTAQQKLKHVAEASVQKHQYKG